MSAYVWDTTILYHADLADRLDSLHDLAGSHHSHLITEVVVAELDKLKVQVPEWAIVLTFDTFDEIRGFATWQQRVANPPHDMGEAATLAAADYDRRRVAIVDDSAARAVGLAHGINVHGSLWVMSQAVLEMRWEPGSVSTLCDTILRTDIRWPFPVGGFTEWARQNSLL